MSDVRRAKALAAIGRHEEAARMLGTVVASEPENAEALVELAVSRHAVNDLGGALEAIESALAADPARPGAWRMRAFVLYDLGRRADAADSAREARRLAPEDWRVHIVLSKVATDPGEAYEAAVRAVELAPEKPVAHVMAAETAVRRGRVADAESSYLEALRLAPNDASTHRGLAALRIRRGRPVAALQSVVAALRADPARGIREETVVGTALAILRRARWVSIVCVIVGLYGMAIAAEDAEGYLETASLVPRGIAVILVAALTYWSLRRPLRRLPAPMRSGLLRVALRTRRVARRAALVAGLTLLAVVAALLPL